jgi:glycosyltransferase involved in cell wall biosynthesis
MRILLVTQYFWPETFIINELVKAIVEQGHSVKVLTGKPNYPEGKIFDNYSQQGCETEVFSSSVEIFRVPLRPRVKGGALNLFRNYLSFLWNGLRFFPRAVKGETFDAILAIGLSPITSVIPAIFLKWKLRIHLAVWVQDLWPESLEATGFVKNKTLLSLVERLVKFIYKKSDTILVQSKAFIEPVTELSHKDKVFYYPNSYDDSDHCMTASRVPEKLLGYIASHFSVVFAGNLGTAQSIETLLSAAENLKTLLDFRLIIVGRGSKLDWLKKEVSSRKLDNVCIAGHFQANQMSQIYDKASALVVSLNKKKIFSYTVPCKIQGYLAAGRPIIASLDGEGARLVDEAGAGLTCPSENSSALADCIQKLYNMSALEREGFGVSGREYFLKHYEMRTQASRLIDLLNDRVGNKVLGSITPSIDAKVL